MMEPHRAGTIRAGTNQCVNCTIHGETADVSEDLIFDKEHGLNIYKYTKP